MQGSKIQPSANTHTRSLRKRKRAIHASLAAVWWPKQSLHTLCMCFMTYSLTNACHSCLQHWHPWMLQCTTVWRRVQSCPEPSLTLKKKVPPQPTTTVHRLPFSARLPHPVWFWLGAGEWYDVYKGWKRSQNLRFFNQLCRSVGLFQPTTIIWWLSSLTTSSPVSTIPISSSLFSSGMSSAEKEVGIMPRMDMEIC